MLYCCLKAAVLSTVLSTLVTRTRPYAYFKVKKILLLIHQNCRLQEERSGRAGPPSPKRCREVLLKKA